MTYILGWNCAGVSYLCGDTVITRIGQDASGPTTTSFGEAHLKDSRQYVSEGMLKIFNLGKAAVAVTGEVTGAREFVAEFASRMSAGESPIEALQSTVRSRTPLTPTNRYSLIVAVCADGTSKLFVFNPTGKQDLIELPNGGGAQLGSLRQSRKNFFPRWIEKLTELFYDAPRVLLHMVLSILQSYGIHDYLIEEGVGGPFVGLAVDGDGVYWQGDILTIIYEPDIRRHKRVATIVRDNVLIVWSGVAETTRYFADAIMGFDQKSWIERWSEEMSDLNRRVEYDYVSLLANGMRAVTVVGMRRQLESEHFRFEPPAPKQLGAAEFEFRFSISNHLEERMKDAPSEGKDGWPPLKWNWVPFKNHYKKGDPPPEWLVKGKRRTGPA